MKMTYPEPDPIWNEDPKAALAEIEARIAQTGVFWAGSGHFKALADLPANLALITSTHIALYNTEISDISALADVPRVTHLTLGKRITDISVVRNLRDLESFNAFPARLTDISPLASCPRLRSIVSLNVANISDLTCLDGMELELFQIHNYQGQRLPRFGRLKSLSVRCDKGAVVALDLSPLWDSKGLQSFITDAAAFNLPNTMDDLEDLNIALRDVQELGILATYPKLDRLSLRGSQITEFGPLLGCQNLRRLSVENAQITDVTSVKMLPRLEELNISGNPVTDIAPLSFLKRLHTIEAASTAVTDLAGWNPDASLRVLNLDKTKVSDLGPLHGTRVYTLTVADTALTSLEGMAKVKGLHRLDVSRTQVETLPLSEQDAEVFHDPGYYDPRDGGWFRFYDTPLLANGFKLLPVIKRPAQRLYSKPEAKPAPAAKSLLARLWAALLGR